MTTFLDRFRNEFRNFEVFNYTETNDLGQHKKEYVKGSDIEGILFIEKWKTPEFIRSGSSGSMLKIIEQKEGLLYIPLEEGDKVKKGDKIKDGENEYKVIGKILIYGFKAKKDHYQLFLEI